MWSAVNNGVSSAPDPMEISLNASIEGMSNMTLADTLGNSAYSHSLDASQSGVLPSAPDDDEPLDDAVSPTPMDVARDSALGADEDLLPWLTVADALFADCRLDAPRLRISKEIGGGAFSTIFLGDYVLEGGEHVPVAVKKMELDKKSGAKHVFPPTVMFTREVAYLTELGRFRHPNIIRLVAACPGIIVTEFVAGGCLYELLHQRHIDFKIFHQLQIARGIANGVMFLHANRFIHRDLTSENVLLTKDGVAKLIDFGFAIKIQQTNKNTNDNNDHNDNNGVGHNNNNNTTASNSVEVFSLRPAGNARWRAPEITRREPYSHLVDVYSFGVVLCEIVTQQPPFFDVERSRDAAQMAAKGMRPAIRQDVDGAVVRLIERCWADNPDERPAGFGVVMSELLEITKRVFNHHQQENK